MSMLTDAKIRSFVPYGLLQKFVDGDGPGRYVSPTTMVGYGELPGPTTIVSLVEPARVRRELVAAGVSREILHQTVTPSDALDIVGYLGALEVALIQGLEHLAGWILNEVLREHGLPYWTMPESLHNEDFQPAGTPFGYLGLLTDPWQIAPWGFAISGHFTRIGTECATGADFAATPATPVCGVVWCDSP